MDSVLVSLHQFRLILGKVSGAVSPQRLSVFETQLMTKESLEDIFKFGTGHFMSSHSIKV